MRARREPAHFFDPGLATMAAIAESLGAFMLAARIRDTRAEYRARVAKAEREGRSRAEGRGHGRRPARRVGARKLLDLSPRERDVRSRVHEALSIARQDPHISLTAAAGRAETSVDAVARYAPSAVERLPSGRYRVKPADRELRVMPLVSAGVVYERVAIAGSRQASRVGEHLAAISTFLETGDDRPLRSFSGKFVTGTLPDGRRVRFELEADPDVIAELAFGGDLSDLVVES